jgi:hypothetical protein
LKAAGCDKTLGIGTGLVQRIVTEQSRPFGVAEVNARDLELDVPATTL